MLSGWSVHITSVTEDPTVTMACAGPSKPLNAEPSQPYERRATGTTPKSYNEAAKQGLKNGTADPYTPPQINGHVWKYLSSDEDPRATVNGLTGPIANLNADSLLEHENDGLTSVREPDDYYVALQQDHKENPSPNQDEPHREELKSGRKAGQRWHQSAYAASFLQARIEG